MTIAYEVNHRFGVCIEWQPDTGSGPAIRLNACTATLGHIPTAYRLRDAFSLAIAEAHAITQAMDNGHTYDPDTYSPVARPVEGETREHEARAEIDALRKQISVAGQWGAVPQKYVQSWLDQLAHLEARI